MRKTAALFMILFITLTCFNGSAANNNAKTRTGQWIWSPADKKLFMEAQKNIPDLEPGIWIGTLAFDHGAVSQRLAISPEIASSARAVAVVVRIDDSLHSLWNVKDPEKVAAEIDSLLSRLMELLAAAGVKPREVQLDYDCPVRRLDAWANVVRILSKNSLKGREVWLTSLPAHVNEPMYSQWFRSVAAGHILQLFDTGISYNQETLKKLSDGLQRQGMPFRIGLGAFERILPAGTTDHHRWFGALSAFAKMSNYQGAWIFPGGRQWLHLYPTRSTN